MGFYGIYDKRFEKKLNKLEKYHINPLDEVIKLLRVLKYSGYIDELEDTETIVLSFFDSGWAMKEEEYPLLKTVHDGFKRPLLKVSHTNYEDFKELYKVVKTAYIFNNKEWENEENINEIIINICQKLIYYVEDYENNEIIPEYSLEYLKQLQDVRYADKSVEKFKSEIEDAVDVILVKLFLDCEFPSAINKSANFLMICNVVKENRLTIAFNDVTTAYLTVLKIIINNHNELIKNLEAGKIVKVEKKILTERNILFLVCIILGLLILFTVF